ncbi:SDR family oxidoreductase [Sphingomonas hankyongi]|uniref:SDR family oxidoreductase n=1 Tax=Sphingomonas hankyongi TaxID=2908209 RepID=A0ABT0S4T1_9SPHN|nr:SDR family oxidoreductase [Sphingomonas hankyongi]MCL6730878.1 SDR family oxidoreductase [Sphingomonas hankyongi]
MPSVLITGANRGIGLEFARQYSGDGWDVIATTRQSSPELDALGVGVETLEMADADAVAAFATKVAQPLDLVIANAGTNHPMHGESAEDARAWQSMMMVNAIGPYILASALLPHMSDGGKMVAISSGMGSIADNGGGWVPYRTSKAALNMAWSSLALQARGCGVACVVLSPGWVKTRMGGAGADISAEQSVGDMRKLIDRLAIGDTGRFLRRDGSELPW